MSANKYGSSQIRHHDLVGDHPETIDQADCHRADVGSVDSALDLSDSPLPDQLGGLERAVLRNPFALAILERSGQLDLPGWYLGAGGIAQTVWNQIHGFEPSHGIKDYDLIYFDSTDQRPEAERLIEERVTQAFADLDIKLDVINEARVHRWYFERFGGSIPPYRSSEHAISTWPTTATSVGVRREAGQFVVCAPFGLHDLFAMIVRPNKSIIDRTVYESKVERWASLWPRLTVIPW